MTAMVGRPDWFGLSMPRQYSSMLNQRWFWFITLLSVTRRTQGWTVTIRLVVGWVNPRYVYNERHSWSGTDEEPISAVTLIMMMRNERRDREREMFLALTDSGFNRIVLHPLMDRNPNPWPTVRAVAMVPSSCKLSDSLWGEHAETGLSERIIA